MSEFSSVVASPRMSSWELTQPEMMMRPLNWDQWWMREFILHRERFVDAAGEAATLAANATNPKCAINMPFHRGKDSYGMKGIYAPIQVLAEREE